MKNHEALPAWGSNQGRNGDEDRPPMQKGDLGLAVALWACSWVLLVGLLAVVGFAFKVFA